jgi:hypothetical protein
VSYRTLPYLPDTAFGFDEATKYIQECAQHYSQAYGVPIEHPAVHLAAVSAYQYKNALKYDPLLVVDVESVSHDRDWVVGYRNNLLHMMLRKIFAEFDMANYDLYPKDFWERYDRVLDWYNQEIAKPLPIEAVRVPRPFRNSKQVETYLKYVKQAWDQLLDSLKCLEKIGNDPRKAKRGEQPPATKRRKKADAPEAVHFDSIKSAPFAFCIAPEGLTSKFCFRFSDARPAGDPSRWQPEKLSREEQRAFCKQAPRRKRLQKHWEEKMKEQGLQIIYPPSIGNRGDGHDRRGWWTGCGWEPGEKCSNLSSWGTRPDVKEYETKKRDVLASLSEEERCALGFEGLEPFQEDKLPVNEVPDRVETEIKAEPDRPNWNPMPRKAGIKARFGRTFSS